MKRTAICLVALAFAEVAAGQLLDPVPLNTKRIDSQRMSQSRDANALFVKARRSFEGRDLVAARRHLASSLELDPEHAPAHLLMARVEYAEKRYEAALSRVLLARSSHTATVALWEKLRADRARDLVAYGRSAVNTGRPGYGNVVPDEPHSANDKDRRDDANRLALDVAEASRIEAEYAFVHGNVLLRLNRHDEAVAQYDEALRLRPDYLEAANNLASLYLSRGMSEKALSVITRGEAGGLTFSPELKKAVETSIPGRSSVESGNGSRPS